MCTSRGGGAWGADGRDCTKKLCFYCVLDMEKHTACGKLGISVHCTLNKSSVGNIK